MDLTYFPYLLNMMEMTSPSEIDNVNAWNFSLDSMKFIALNSPKALKAKYRI